MTERAGYGVRRDYKLLKWEQGEFPIACASCLGDTETIRFLRRALGAECKTCTRPFATFTWKNDEMKQTIRTEICSTCAKIRNCCQSCIKDLDYGLNIDLRDKLLGDQRVNLLLSEGNKDIFANLANENFDRLSLPYDKLPEETKRKLELVSGRHQDPALAETLRSGKIPLDKKLVRAIAEATDPKTHTKVFVRFVQEDEFKDLITFFSKQCNPESFTSSIENRVVTLEFKTPEAASKFMRIFEHNTVIRGKKMIVGFNSPEAEQKVSKRSKSPPPPGETPKVLAEHGLKRIKRT